MTSFFARPIQVFGSVAALILCLIFSLTPFALRGARKSLERMENNVKDWLPSDFPETRDLEWFGKHFVGERFVLVTWPGCREDSPQYQLLVEKLRREIVIEDEEQALKQLADGDTAAERAQAAERLRARRLADRLSLFATGNYYENWGGLGERWLLGENQQWYYVTPAGGLYVWQGKPNLPSAVGRLLVRLVTGGNRIDGELITQLGSPSTAGRMNEFFADPRKVTARFFKTIQTGPDLLAELTQEGGPLWPRLTTIADEDKPLVARKEALDRLTGTMFGPAVQPGFSWQADAFWEKLPEATRQQLPADWTAQFDGFVDRLILREYEGDREALLAASAHRQSVHWDALFLELGIPSPPRQTSIVVTLSEAGKSHQARVIGRPIMRKPAGRLIDLATNECSIPLSELKLGGPPVDNVAIDEEGTITLFRLIGWSAVLGIGLSYLCFRSVKVTTMVFFVGGVSAVTSLSIVWWCGASVDAVLMSMPSLVYVLGLSGAVHIVNYYRDAVHRRGLEGAPERALAHGWGPCTLAAFTTALGLVSLYSSSLLPIKKFGLFSALGVLATLVLLFAYLPAALQLWPPGYQRREGHAGHAGEGLTRLVERFWLGVGRWILKRHVVVVLGCLLLMAGMGLGLAKINTSVQLLKLFDEDAKIIEDYRWLEANFGKLVPMELVVRVHPEMMQPSQQALAESGAAESGDARFQLKFLERMELAARVQSWVEEVFGADGQDIVGQGLSAVTFAPQLPPPSYAAVLNPERWGYINELEKNREAFLASDYLTMDEEPQHRGSELWRVSLRLGALNDVDYGEFVHEQKLVVEPVLTAYRHRTKLLQQLAAAHPEGKFVGARVGFIGTAPTQRGSGHPQRPEISGPEAGPAAASSRRRRSIDQTTIYASTLRDLLIVAGCSLEGWIDPGAESVSPSDFTSDTFAAILDSVDCVVLVDDHPSLDQEFIRQHARQVFDARNHTFNLDDPASLSAADRNDPIQVVYTGVVPVVYKAQRTLLNSLIYSIGMAFTMIAAVMMVLLRDWHRPPGITNVVNVPGGLLSMVPNVFPVMLVFGAMGHLGVLVDIGTMMCASVAMGVAVDDTIHFLSWFRQGIREGLSRSEAVLAAYQRVATAMTQTTLIGGLGLAVFALSTFTPTQRFGVMMVTLLFAALVGDLIFLPALLASPLGRWFCPREKRSGPAEKWVMAEPVGSPVPATPHSSAATPAETPHSGKSSRFRRDRGHRWPQ